MNESASVGQQEAIGKVMSGSIEHASDGSFIDYIGSCVGLTDARLLAEALCRVAGRLIDNHDREQARIAHELHDNIGTSLATLGMKILGLGQPASSPAECQPDIQAMYEELQEIGSRVSHLSNQLLPPMLKYFGLAKAIEVECSKFSERWHIPVSCSCGAIPAEINPTLQRNCFKILEEALRNAGQHSRATRVVVKLTVSPKELILEVSDDGVGFDVKQARLGCEIGLIIVGGRVRLIGGQFELRSQPGQGTTIVCRAPLASPESQSARNESKKNVE